MRMIQGPPPAKPSRQTASILGIMPDDTQFRDAVARLIRQLEMMSGLSAHHCSHHP